MTEPLGKPLTEPLAEDMPNTPHPASFTFHPRANRYVCLWLLVVETLISPIISQRARAMMTQNPRNKPMTSRRVLVTGSRDWANGSAVWHALQEQAQQGDFVVVHGACRFGADQDASTWARLTHHAEEQHPADWKAHGKAAGPMRNQEMVDLGADVCLAFPLPDSRGTVDCMHRAEKAGIPVINYGAQR